MTDIDDATVRAMVDAADHDSVTAELLAGGDRYSQLYLYDDPIVSYLEPQEQPHYAFFNEMKGIGIDAKRNTVSPDSGGLTVMTITDRRTLAVVGKADGDECFEIPHEAVTGVEYSDGLMKHRLVIRTDETTYHCWIDASYEESALAAATDALRTYRDRAASRTRSRESPPATSDGGRDGTPGGAAPDEVDPASSAGDPGDDDGAGTADEDPLETLERLADLNEKGVISDEEFAEKKADLLDQI